MLRDRKSLRDYEIRSYWSKDLVCVIKMLVLKGMGHIYGAIRLIEKGHPVM